MKNIENKILDFVAGISPWLTPLIPTYFAVYNALEYLTKGKNGWDILFVIIIGIAVETVGLAGVHTAIQFWNWNRTKGNAIGKQAPMLLIGGAVLVYIAIVILVNVLLDFYSVFNPAALPYVRIVVIALLSLLSLNSALIVALRASQNDRVAEFMQEQTALEKYAIEERKRKEELELEERQRKEDERKERNQRRRELQDRKNGILHPQNTGNFPVSSQQLSDNFPVTYQSQDQDWRTVRPDEKAWMLGKSQKQIQDQFGISERTANNWYRRINNQASALAEEQVLSN